MSTEKTPRVWKDMRQRVSSVSAMFQISCGPTSKSGFRSSIPSRSGLSSLDEPKAASKLMSSSSLSVRNGM